MGQDDGQDLDARQLEPGATNVYPARIFTQGADGFRLVGDAGPLFTALAKAQAAFGEVQRTRRVTVRPKDQSKSPYTFEYAPLDEVLAKTRPALNAQGLALIQPIVEEGGGIVVRTILAHSSGAFMETSMRLGRPDSMQDLGSKITYARRYMVGSLLGVAPEEDDDGNGADGNEREVQARQPQGRKVETSKPKSAPHKDEKPADEKKPAGSLRGACSALFAALKYNSASADERCKAVLKKGKDDVQEDDLFALCTALKVEALAKLGRDILKANDADPWELKTALEKMP